MSKWLMIGACLLLAGCSEIPLDRNPNVDGRNWDMDGHVYVKPRGDNP